MKTRKFYPIQVLRALDGRSIQEIDNGQRMALVYFIMRILKINQDIFITNDDVTRNMAAMTSSESAEAVIGNVTARIHLKNPASPRQISDFLLSTRKFNAQAYTVSVSSIKEVDGDTGRMKMVLRDSKTGKIVDENITSLEVAKERGVPLPNLLNLALDNQ